MVMANDRGRVTSPLPHRLNYPPTVLVSVLIIAESARGCLWNRNLKPNFCPGGELNPRPLGRQSSSLTTVLSSTPLPTLNQTIHPSFLPPLAFLPSSYCPSLSSTGQT